MHKEDKTTNINVSPAVRSRLPRYYRYLSRLVDQGKLRISSSELAELMNVTASQIRQDLNCFGGFGQQGYGYNVRYLLGKISDILGLGKHYSAVIVGAGYLGQSIATIARIGSMGKSLKALFSIAQSNIGKEVWGVPILSIEELVDYCNREKIDVVTLAVHKSAVSEVEAVLPTIETLKGVLNFTEVELHLPEHIAVEDVHLDDYAMLLCYDMKLIAEKRNDEEE